MLQKVIMQKIIMQNIKDAKYYLIDEYCNIITILTIPHILLLCYITKSTNLKTLLCKQSNNWEYKYHK